MRIAMVGPFGFHPNKTMRSRAWQLARVLVKRGHAVKIFMPPWQSLDEADREWEEGGVAIRYVSLAGGTVGTAVRMVRETLAWKPQVVHAFKPKAYSGLVAWWLWNFHKGSLRLVTDTDDWEGWGGWNDLAPYTSWQKHFFAWQEKWGLHHCHALTVASRTLQSIAWALGVPADKVIYLPNGPGIDFNVTDQSSRRAELALEGRPVLLLYSRLFEFSTRRLVTILQHVKAELPDLAILLVGMSLFEEEATTFRRQLETADLSEAVVDVGWVAEEELPSLLASTDVGLYLMDDTLLNRTKCPVKLADMLSVGLPVVGEDVGQVSEYILHRRTGLLRTSGDTAGIAEDLVSLLENSSFREELSLAARAYIQEKFTWDRLADTAERAYGRQRPAADR